LDCHEYAREQYNFDNHPDPQARFDWLFVARPLCDALQSEYYRKADAVSTVSDGIADLLQQDYRLPKRTSVIRSTSFYEELPFRPCSERIEILYHGLIDQSRNLDVAIRSMAMWRPEFHFVIRGPANPEYEVELLALARRLGVQDRVTIEPPVAFSELVRAANASDVGYCVVENYSAQRQFAAPNKFFEYMMAGLALVFTDTTEQAKINNTYGNGLLVGSLDPKVIAQAINSLTRDRIDEMKKRSLAAAKELCWEQESVKLVEAYGIDR
jgi:glycosyltransferase involved in cell wall biosynthesis